MSDQFHHRSLFSSKNRPFKGKSKGKTEKLNRGKVDSSSSLAANPKQKSSEGGKKNNVGTHRIPIKHSIELRTKEARYNRAKQLQRQAREDIYQQKRIGNKQGPPKIVALIPLGGSVNLAQIVSHLKDYADSTNANEADKKIESSTNALITPIAINMSGRQRRLTLYATPRDTNSVLDIGKVADLVLFVLGTPNPNAGPDEVDVDQFGQHALAILKAQGMPASMGLQIGVAAAAPKKQAGLKNMAQRFFDTACGAGTKVMNLDNSQNDAANFYRWVAGDIKLKDLTWREHRPYLLAEQISYEAEVGQPIVPAVGQFSFSSAPLPVAPTNTVSLRLRGYLRGENPLLPNQLFHVTGYGDFQIAKVEGRVEEVAVFMTEKEKKQSRAASKAASRMVSRRGSLGGDEEMGDDAAAPVPSKVSALQPASAHSKASDIVLQSCPAEQAESLVGLVPLNPLANEQSLIDDDELLEDDATFEDEHEEKGMHDGDYDDEDGEDDDEDMDQEKDHRDTSGKIIESGRRKRFAEISRANAPTAASLAAKRKAASKPGAIVKSVAWDDAVPAEDEEDDEEGAEADAAFSGVNMDEDRDLANPMLEKRKLERDEQEFPDEVEFPTDTLCKERFQRYRGLKSFLHSTWDAKENLPLEYGQIFQFSNFEASKNRVIKDASYEGGIVTEDNSVFAQRFFPVTITLRAVPLAIAQSVAATLSPVVGFGVFQYEHKVSVLHLNVKRANEYEAPIKAKEPMEFHIAFRRFIARPVYSLETKGDKQLSQRFFQKGTFCTASIYGRIVFPQASVLMLKPTAQHSSLVLGETQLAQGVTLAQALVPQPLTQIAHIPFVSPIVASGTLSAVNPDKLVIKRIVLTGTPISVHKRNAVVRHMFFNADDVRWFKPVELWTKYGLVGHIKESRGTKGYMKCQFDKFIKQNDTVCMSLYKRQYPPWNEDLFQGNL